MVAIFTTLIIFLETLGLNVTLYVFYVLRDLNTTTGWYLTAHNVFVGSDSLRNIHLVLNSWAWPRSVGAWGAQALLQISALGVLRVYFGRWGWKNLGWLQATPTQIESFLKLVVWISFEILDFFLFGFDFDLIGALANGLDNWREEILGVDNVVPVLVH